MPKQTITLSIFVASPSDVLAEREIVKNVVDELNQTFCKPLQLHLEMIGWENATYPAFGDYPQGVINSQIGDEYDIFIGILWSRFGTPTKNALSGTQEEFERVLTRFHNDKNVEICFYFKTDDLDPYKIDLDQFKKVKEFKSSLSQLGGYHWDFNSTHFKDYLRNHLTLICNKLITRPNELTSNFAPKEHTPKIIDEDEDEGFYDLLEDMTSLFKSVTDDLQSFSYLTNNHNEMLNHYTNRLDKHPDDFKTKKSIINESSDYMANYARKAENKFRSIEDKFELALTKFNYFLEIYPEIHNLDNAKELTTMLNAFDHTIIAIPIMVEGNSSFLNAVRQLPRMTTNLTRSKKLMIATLEPFIEYMQSLEAKLLNLQQQGFSLLKDLNQSEYVN